jgi:hypothetical protein
MQTNLHSNNTTARNCPAGQWLTQIGKCRLVAAGRCQAEAISVAEKGQTWLLRLPRPSITSCNQWLPQRTSCMQQGQSAC